MPRGPAVTDGEVEHMVELREAGLTLREIKVATGRSLSVICRRLQREGVDARPPHYWTPAECALLDRLYEDGVPIDVIAQRLPRRSISKIYDKAWKRKLKRPAGPVVCTRRGASRERRISTSQAQGARHG